MPMVEAARGKNLSQGDLAEVGVGLPRVNVSDALRNYSAPHGDFRWQTLDAAWVSYVDRNSEIPHRWLLIQTMATSVLRRHILAMLAVQPGWRTLDIGTGFGPIPMELASLAPIEAHGIDVDSSVLQAADRGRLDVDGRGGFHAGSQVSFAVGNAYGLTQDDRSIDLVTARFVFQHL